MDLAGARVSVAMATYNGAAFLQEQLASLATQTQLPHELVVVDDASEDATVDILGAFAAEAPFPVRIERNRVNVGWRESFATAISACGGDLIAPCDQDDVWVAEKLRMCAAWFDAEPGLALVVHSSRVVDDALVPSRRRQPSFRRTRVVAPESLPFRFAHHGMSLVFPRWLPQSVGGARPLDIDRGSSNRMGHDQWICLLAMLAGPVALLADELVLYRRHDANASNLRPLVVPGGPRRGILDIEVKAAAYDFLATRLDGVADYLEATPVQVPHVDAAVVAARAQRRAGQYRLAADLHRRRASVADASAGRGTRLARVAALALSGAYRTPGRVGLGLAAAAADVAVAIVPARRPSRHTDISDDARATTRGANG